MQQGGPAITWEVQHLNKQASASPVPHLHKARERALPIGLTDRLDRWRRL